MIKQDTQLAPGIKVRLKHSTAVPPIIGTLVSIYGDDDCRSNIDGRPAWHVQWPHSTGLAWECDLERVEPAIVAGVPDVNK